MGTPNWGNLKQQGRCKDIGLPWSAEEVHAVFVLKVPAEYVRRGCLTTDEYEALKKKDETFQSKNGELPVAAMPREELLKKAKEAGLEITNDTTDETLRAVLTPFQKVKKEVVKKVVKKTKK